MDFHLGLSACQWRTSSNSDAADPCSLRWLALPSLLDQPLIDAIKP